MTDKNLEPLDDDELEFLILYSEHKNFSMFAFSLTKFLNIESKLVAHGLIKQYTTEITPKAKEIISAYKTFNQI